MIHSLNLVRTLSWAELLEIWKKKEEKVWEGYIEENGLKDWDDYRFGPLGTLTRYGFDEFNLSDQIWKEFHMPDIHMIAPRLYTGPFRSWTKHNKENPNASQPFIQLVQYPEIRENEDVLYTKKFLMEGNPSFGIGLFEPEQDRIALFDGHHTFSALNILLEEGYKDKLPAINLYLAEVPSESKEYFYDLLEGKIEPVGMPKAKA